MKTVTENNNNNKNNRIKRKEIQKRNSFLTFNRVWEVFWIKMSSSWMPKLLRSSLRVANESGQALEHIKNWCCWVPQSRKYYVRTRSEATVFDNAMGPKTFRENEVLRGYSLWQRDGAENIAWKGCPTLQSLTTQFFMRLWIRQTQIKRCWTD